MMLSDEEMVEERYALLEKESAHKGIDIDSVKKKVSEFDMEVPSWVFGPFGGGRFSGYTAPGAANNIFEKIDDAALIHGLTGATLRVAINVSWDDPDKAPSTRLKQIRSKRSVIQFGLGFAPGGTAVRRPTLTHLSRILVRVR